MPPRKSSAGISFVLIGIATLSACDSGPRFTKRDYYASAAAACMTY